MPLIFMLVTRKVKCQGSAHLMGLLTYTALKSFFLLLNININFSLNYTLL